MKYTWAKRPDNVWHKITTGKGITCDPDMDTSFIEGPRPSPHPEDDVCVKCNTHKEVESPGSNPSLSVAEKALLEVMGLTKGCNTNKEKYAYLAAKDALLSLGISLDFLKGKGVVRDNIQ